MGAGLVVAQSPMQLRLVSSPMLKRLRLRNVGPAPELELELAPRLNLITGDNGLGKSFLLDVMWWALTQTWAREPARPAKGVHEAEILFGFGSNGNYMGISPPAGTHADRTGAAAMSSDQAARALRSTLMSTVALLYGTALAVIGDLFNSGHIRTTEAELRATYSSPTRSGTASNEMAPRSAKGSSATGRAGRRRTAAHSRSSRRCSTGSRLLATSVSSQGDSLA